MTNIRSTKKFQDMLPWPLLKLLLVFSLFAVWGTFISIQYFDINPIPSMFFLGDDGWCDKSSSEGIGSHCFGDFGFMIQASAGDNPWLGMNNYTAAGNAMFVPFRMLYEFTGSYNLSLGVYLAAAAAALIWPVWIFSSTWRLSWRLSLVAASLSSFPFLFALDRGNSIVFAVPAIYGWLVAIKGGDLHKARGWLILATLVKPQFIILSLLFLRPGHLRWLVTTVGMAAVAHLAFFALWWKSFPGNLLDAAKNIAGYQQYVDLSFPWPSNISLARPTFWLELVVRFVLGLDTQPAALPGFITVQNGSIISILIALILVALTLTIRTNELGLRRAVNLLIIASLFSSVSFSYYLVFTIPLLLVLLGEDDSILRSPRDWPDRILIVALALSLVRFPLPLPYSTSTNDYVLTSGELIPLAFVGFILSTLFSEHLSRKRLSFGKKWAVSHKFMSKAVER